MRSLGLAMMVEDFFGIAVIGSDNHDAAELVNPLGEASELDVDSLDCDDGGLKFAVVPDHVATWEVETNELDFV